MSSPDGTAPASTTAADVPAPDTTVPAAAPDTDDDVIDAELVPEPSTSFSPPVATPAFDYTDAGVPTLDYLRDRIEKRLGTAEGSAELAGAQDAQERQRKADEERAEKAAAKLAEIRRQVTEGR